MVTIKPLWERETSQSLAVDLRRKALRAHKALYTLSCHNDLSPMSTELIDEIFNLQSKLLEFVENEHDEHYYDSCKRASSLG